jgi:hypothetical protein
MKKDFYVDSIMGSWVHDKRKSNKTNICYTRKAPVTLHKDNALDWTDATDFKQYKVHGDVVLTERKLIELSTSNQSLFRGIELTDKTIKTPVIP